MIKKMTSTTLAALLFLTQSTHADVPKKASVDCKHRAKCSCLESESNSIIGQLLIIVWINMALAATDNVC